MVRGDVTDGQRAEEVEEVVQGDVELPVVLVGTLDDPLDPLPLRTPVRKTMVKSDFLSFCLTWNKNGHMQSDLKSPGLFYYVHHFG